MTRSIQLACACGQVHLEAENPPIISAECHCNSCREAGDRLSKLPSAHSVLKTNGGTHFVLYRKDRIRVVKGAEQLVEFRLTPTSKTRRIIAACCNTPVFLEFESGHWLSVYAGLWPEGTLSAIELRTMTGDRTDGPALTDDVPSGRWQTTKFFAKLLGAWIAMGFKSPKITVNGEIEA